MIATLRTSLAAIFGGLREPVVLTLGVTQTIGYGSMYYAYGVLAPSISRDLGVGLDVFFALFTAGLVAAGLCAPFAGRALDRYGARVVMTWGSLVAAAALAACALAPGIASFAFAVVLVEIAGCAVLYEAAFAGLTQIYRHGARRNITAITLIAGFASTIFWPLTQMLQDTVGWRWSFAIFALAHLAVCVPAHFIALRRARPHRAADITTDQPVARPPPVHMGADRVRAILLYTVAICVSGIVYSSIPIHMLSIIQAQGFTPQAAAAVAMVMGPAQVLARIVEIAFGRRFDALVTGQVSLAMLVAAIIMLVGLGGTGAAIAFAALYGASQGLITIARGTVPLLLFGVEGYGALVGRITGLRFIVNAAGPFTFAWIATQGGMPLAIMANGIAAVTALCAFLALRRPADPEAAAAWDVAPSD